MIFYEDNLIIKLRENRESKFNRETEKMVGQARIWIKLFCVLGNSVSLDIQIARWTQCELATIFFRVFHPEFSSKTWLKVITGCCLLKTFLNE